MLGAGRVGGGGREPWRAAHLLSLSWGEAGEATQLLLPLPGFGDSKTGLLCPLLRAPWFRFVSFIPGP